MNFFTDPPSRRETYIAIVAVSVLVSALAIYFSFAPLISRLDKSIDRLEAASVTQTNNQQVIIPDDRARLEHERITTLYREKAGAINE
jgi:hypothetical protein